MKILVISDIHANLTALEAVLAECSACDAVWCLGDIVGYGPDPEECIFRLQKLPNLHCVLGNHDAAVIDELDMSTFNEEARVVIRWTKGILSENAKTFLHELPSKRVIDQVTLVHGSPRFPIWEYLLDSYTARLNFAYFETMYCFNGHSHLPTNYILNDNHNETVNIKNDKSFVTVSVPETDQPIFLQNRTILNPGSIGQPRDRDPRAAYAIYDSENQTWELKRVSYDDNAVQARMQIAGLPEKHIKRITSGW